MEDTIQCDFCSWICQESELLKNGHCPKCQSPSTKPTNAKRHKIGDYGRN